MGLCCCTLISCPIGLVAGGVMAPVLGNERTLLRPQGRSRKELLILFGGLLLAGFLVLYLPLTIVCAQADHKPWRLYPSDSLNCMSEGGDSSLGVLLGLAAGFVMGAGVAGLLGIFLCGCGSRQNEEHEDQGIVSRTIQSDDSITHIFVESVQQAGEGTIV